MKITLKERTQAIRHEDGRIFYIKYPKYCPLYPILGDYCWGLAIAYEDKRATEFKKKSCPNCLREE